MEDVTTTGMIRRIIQEELRYLRHYIGKVVDIQDPNSKGRVRVQVPDIGWDTNAKSPWCWPRQLHAMVVPKVGEWVEVYFVAGDRTRAVYLGQVGELTGNLPAAYSQTTDKVLYQDPDSGDSIVHDAQAGEFHIRGSGKHLVTFEDLDSAISSFKTSIESAISTAISGHTHPGVMSGPSSSGTGAGDPPSISVDISAAKTPHLKTDG